MTKLTYEAVLHGTEPEKKKSPAKYPAGLRIQEPMTEFPFTVEETDVVGSTVADKESCAAARALCRIPDIDHAWVFRSTTLIRHISGKIERYKNPSNLMKAVDGFDNSAGLFPAGEYVLKPLPPGRRRDAKKRWNDANKDRRGGARPYKYGTPPKPLRKK